MSDTVEDSLAPHYCYAHVESNGVISSATSSQVPYPEVMMTALGVVAMTYEQFTAYRSGGNWKWEDGGLVAYTPDPPPPPSLETVRARALVAVDVAAERARQQFLTPGAGQAMEYQATQQDARDALAAVAAGEALTGSGYPWIEAERLALLAAGETATLLEVAQSVVDTTAAWTAAGAEIKRVRRAAKMAIENCDDAAAVETVLASLAWPSAA